MSIASAWDRFWFAEASLTRLASFRILIMALVMMNFIAYSSPAFHDAAAVSAGVGMRQWSPIYLFEILRLQPIGESAAHWVFGIALVSSGLAMVGLFTRISCAVTAVLHIYWHRH